MTVRMSALPIVRFCSKARELSVGSGRAAAMGTAFHAYCSSDPKADDLLARLSDEERAEVLSWERPADIVVGDVMLRYDDAAHEAAVAFTAKGQPCEHGSPEALTEGHLDMAWEVVVNGKKVAYIGDIKKTRFTTTDGPDSLQTTAYGFAWALKHGCDAFCAGIWMATEAEWHWGDLVYLDSDKAAELWEQIVAAATNKDGQYATGSHCRGCYERLRCPAHLVAPGDISQALSLLQGPLSESDEGRVRDLLLQAQAAEDAIKVVKATAQEYATRFGLRDPETGKVYKPVHVKGRESFDGKALKKDAEVDPALVPALKYFKRGASYEQWRWLSGGKS